MEKLSIQEKYLFCDEMKSILDSGIRIEDGLELLRENLSGSLSDAAWKLADALMQGVSFDQAVSDCGYFDAYFTEMVKIGQMNGCDDLVMRELSKYYRREDDLEGAVKQAVSYPLVLSFLMLIITGILFFAVIPVFENVLLKINVSGNSAAMKMMYFGKGFAGLCFVILLAVMIAAAVYGIYAAVTKDTEINNKLLMKFPLSAKLYQSILTARITYALSMFVHSGASLEDAVSYLPALVSEAGMKKKLEVLNQRLAEQDTFIEAVKASGIYSKLNESILDIGLKAGRQEETFERLCAIYEKESEEKISHFLGVIEPSMVAILSLMTGVILMSVMMPLMSIMSMIG